MSTLVIVVLALSRSLLGAPADHAPSEILGLWRGTSVCTDRVAAPACNDEVIVYEFKAGPKPGTVRWQADKVVDGRRESMGDALDMAYDPGDACWRTEFRSPRVHVVWCLTVTGDDLMGSAWLLPGKATVRKVEAHRERGPSS
ncbi:MAG TPA: hypothetical protein VFQ51_03350 [Vicinamibacteria bacterium]|nr:hypothetical protein [Vicinamibacteria bacterium]